MSRQVDVARWCDNDCVTIKKSAIEHGFIVILLIYIKHAAYTRQQKGDLEKTPKSNRIEYKLHMLDVEVTRWYPP